MAAKKKQNRSFKKIFMIAVLAICAVGFYGKCYVVHSEKIDNRFTFVVKRTFDFKECYIDLDRVMHRKSSDKLKDLIETIEWMNKHPEIKGATSHIDWTKAYTH